MTYREAKELHNEDQVIVKKTGRYLQIVSVEDFGNEGHKDVFFLLENGNKYHHTEVK